MIRFAISALAVGGCAIGAGGSFIGQWRPRDVKVFDACLVDDAGRCTDHKDVTSHVPERSFSAVVIQFPGVGASSVSYDGHTDIRARLEPTIEYLRGSSRWAVGLRSGASIDVNGATAVPVTALGHLSVSDRVAIYGGAGYLPFAQQHGEQAYVGLQGVAGIQLALTRSRSQNYTAITVEADSTWIDFGRSYRSTGVTGNFGVFF